MGFQEFQSIEPAHTHQNWRGWFVAINFDFSVSGETATFRAGFSTPRHAIFLNIFSYIFILEPLPYLFYFHGYYCNYIPFSVLSPLILLKHRFFHHSIVCPMVFPCVSRFLHFLKMGVPLFSTCVFHVFFTAFPNSYFFCLGCPLFSKFSQCLSWFLPTVFPGTPKIMAAQACCAAGELRTALGLRGPRRWAGAAQLSGRYL